jgi:hypothetical protein
LGLDNLGLLDIIPPMHKYTILIKIRALLKKPEILSCPIHKEMVEFYSLFLA